MIRTSIPAGRLKAGQLLAQRWRGRTSVDHARGAARREREIEPQAAAGKYNGVAPGADLVSVKAFGASGQGTYSDVIRGIDWVVSNKAAYGTRVLNLSISATPISWYFDDPLAQAAMAAWQAGIVVVTSAGNGGPSPMSIGVPGNVPYVITAGAMSDALTPGDGETTTWRPGRRRGRRSKPSSNPTWWLLAATCWA